MSKCNVPDDICLHFYIPGVREQFSTTQQIVKDRKIEFVFNIIKIENCCECVARFRTVVISMYVDVFAVLQFIE